MRPSGSVSHHRSSTPCAPPRPPPLYPSGRAISQVYASPRVVKRMECGGLWPVRVLAHSRDVTALLPRVADAVPLQGSW